MNQYCQSMELLDWFNKNQREVPEWLLDYLDPFWYKLSKQEQEDFAKFSQELHKKWTPLEKYLDAVDCYNTSQTESGKEHWNTKKDEYYLLLNEIEKLYVDKENP